MELHNTKTFRLSSQLQSEQAVLWVMAQVAHRQSVPHFNLLQETIKHLSNKVLGRMPLEANEEQFLQALFSCPWWGGEEHGFNESLNFLPPKDYVVEDDSESIPVSASKNILDVKQLDVFYLMQHYLNGEGQLCSVNLLNYKTSIIVSDVVNALKKYIVELNSKNKPCVKISTKDSGFLKSKYAAEVEGRRRDSDFLGYIFNDGTMMLEQKNTALRNFSNRFLITAMTTKMGAKLNTRWGVDGFFSFQSFEQSQLNLGLPLTSSMVLDVPPGLGAHMVDLGRAKPFQYFVNWADMYSC